jgi:formylglycine-generating enzyme required for sulfatase activity
MAVARNPGAIYFIPSENEWYKAAYYNPSNGTYWTYTTQINTAPGNTLPDTGNNANYDNYNFATNTDDYTDPTNYLTPVGAFSESPGPYGTYDMGGDIWQWTEGNIDNVNRVFLGGSWDNGSFGLVSSYQVNADPSVGFFTEGFRVANDPTGWVPEPSTITLLLASAACLLGYAWRRRTA